jgi:hypothetical protein
MNSVAPVLFLIFNRPETTKRVFEVIREAKPPMLFVAADGPRPERMGEAEQCMEARKIIEQVDWNCDVKTLYRQENLGCKRAIRSAIDWFFTYVEEGIILEDDCLADVSFFSFSTLMLERYRQIERIKIISGTNFFLGKYDNHNDYYFSKFMAIWGWAAWKRSWQEINFSVKELDSSFVTNLNTSFKNDRFKNWLRNMVQSTLEGKIDAWSPYLVHSFILNDGMALSAFRNLISNIGYNGTNMSNVRSDHPFFNMKMKSIKLDDIPPSDQVVVSINPEAESLMMKMVVKYDAPKTFFRILMSRIKKYFY